VVCIAVLLRHVWPLHGASQAVALGLIAAAAIVWAVVLLAAVTSDADRDGQLTTGRRLFPLITAGTLILSIVAFVLAFFAPA
jgi:hypothetical protein